MKEQKKQVLGTKVGCSQNQVDTVSSQIKSGLAVVITARTEILLNNLSKLFSSRLQLFGMY